jgi:hypothetical protein
MEGAAAGEGIPASQDSPMPPMAHTYGSVPVHSRQTLINPLIFRKNKYISRLASGLLHPLAKQSG